MELKNKKEKEREQRMKEYEEKKKQEMEELERKQKEEEEREKRKKEKFEMENKKFLKEQAKKIRKEFKDIMKEKKSIQQAEKEYEEMNLKLKEEMKKKMEKFFEENKENLKKDKEEKAAINKFMKAKQVTKVFNAYDAQLKYMFDFYCKSDHHDLSTIEKAYENMNYREFIKFGYESNVIPTVIPINEILYIYNQLARERNDEDPKASQELNYEYFKKALVRISAVGQALLGGQNGPKFEKKMEELKEKEEKDKKKKELLAKKYSSVTPGVTKKKTKKDEDDISRDEDAESPGPESRKAKKASERKEGTLYERGAKPPRQKIVIPNPKEDKLKSATIIKGKLNEEMLLSKKSQSINKLYEIDSKAQVVDHLKKIRVENSRVTTECDVSIISDKTIEALLKHIGLDPVDVEGEPPKFTQELKFKMDEKLNSRKMDIQGAKPNKIKKSNVPEKAEVLSNFEAAVSEEDEAEGDQSEGEGEKDKKNKKGKKEKDDDNEDKD